ncbi:hypothetical protein NHX12_013172 [Muraenolepis orangiensis]|uniref:Uncharacterized protein n=1 Tax=Muraenolepis orangiensis TaxID=630683 RepID=A0A9Q0I5N3_9TELE|nr:hypothetical protein NHX12_013172 [Muraenolepis orangiensis]
MKRRKQTCSSGAKAAIKASAKRREKPNPKRRKLDKTERKTCSRGPATAPPRKSSRISYVGGCKGSCPPEKQEDEGMDSGIFPDDDSNQVLPVEQFFGNLDAMQDVPQTVASGTGTSLWDPRDDHPHQQRRRRRHYYAREDSDKEELSDGDTQLSRPGDS